VAPVVSEPTVTGELAPMADSVTPPVLEVHVARYPSTGLPPLLPAVKATEPELVPGVTAPMVGALGAVAATQLPEAADAGLLPMTLVASAVQV
jgi:hypothetical protein